MKTCLIHSGVNDKDSLISPLKFPFLSTTPYGFIAVFPDMKTSSNGTLKNRKRNPINILTKLLLSNNKPNPWKSFQAERHQQKINNIFSGFFFLFQNEGKVYVTRPSSSSAVMMSSSMTLINNSVIPSITWKSNI